MFKDLYLQNIIKLYNILKEYMITYYKNYNKKINFTKILTFKCINNKNNKKLSMLEVNNFKRLKIY